MMRSFQGIIFDLDGVLVFSDQMHYEAWKMVADRLGIPFDTELNHKLRGVSRMESLDIILSNTGLVLSPSEKESIASQKNERYRELLNSLTPQSVAGETLTVLQTLRERGVKLAVGSSSKNARFILERTGLSAYMDAVADGTDITHSKPHPEVFLKAASFLDLAPTDCAVVEDAVAGIDAAKAGGFIAIGIGDASVYEKADAGIQTLVELLG